MEKNVFFTTMLKQAKEKMFTYIGTGNPTAQILIVGKECANESDDADYNMNLSLWERDKDKDLWDFPLRDRGNYTPLCPYKGQFNKLDNRNNPCWGTNKTWLNYQKLHNYIFGDSYGRINFHKNIFTTEINDSPSPKTKSADKSSIASRKDFIKNSTYFQSFPVVILAGVEYYKIKKNYNEIEDMFGVEFKEKRCAGNNKKQPYWIHCNNDKTKMKMVINTYQLSSYVTNKLLKEVADLIKEYFGQCCALERISEEKRWICGGKEIHEALQNRKIDIESDDYKDYMTWV